MSETQPISPLTRSLIRALSHPVQCKVIACLGEGFDVTAKQIAERTETPLRSVRHYLGRLEESGLVERTAQERRRGVREHSYRLTVPPIVDVEEFAALTPTERMRVSTENLKQLFSDVSTALAGGTFDQRLERCLAFVRAEVDEQGWLELARLHLKTYEEAERVKRECKERLRLSGDTPIRAVSAVMWFEMPPRKAGA